MQNSEAKNLGEAKNQDMGKLAIAATTNAEILSEIVNALETGTRRERQRAARVVKLVSDENPELLLPFVDVLVEATDRPEAQTRWEVLEALSRLVPYAAESCDGVLEAAETSLFDEESGLARLAAVRFMCKLGATNEARSEKVWPLIDEAVQCYHGDQEFQDMLLAVIEFSAGSISSEVKNQLVARMAFDATNGKGPLKRRASQIVENASK